MGYTSSFLKGLGWSSGLKIVSKVLSAIKIAILARLLSPTDFGVFSLVLVSLSLIEVFTQTGINTIIVQSEKKLAYFLDTAWVISLVRGVLIAIGMILLSYPMSHFYHSPSVLSLVILASVIPIIRGAINPAIVSLHKNLQFQQDTWYRFSLVVVDLVCSVSFVFIYRNVLSLILAIIVAALFEVWLTFFFFKQRPRLRFEHAVARDIFTQTKWLHGFAILDYLNKNVDNLLVGKVIGVTALGLYQNGFATSQAITAELGNAVIHASFPIYTHMADDIDRLRRAFVKVLTGFALVLLIPTLLMVFFPQLIVTILLGAQWNAVVAFLPALAIAGYIQALINMSSSVFVARKSYRWLTLTLSMITVTMVISMIPSAMRWGTLGASYSVMFSRIVAVPVLGYGMFKTLYDQKKSAHHTA